MRLARPSLPAVAVMAASTAMLFRLAVLLFPAGARWTGQDYSYFFPYLVTGANWIRLHGWFAPPYFTPDFCGGLPWLGNPQSAFYSAPQLLATFLDPIVAMRWTLIASATVGAVSMYLLLRRCLGASVEAATLGFALFQLNGFILFRMAVGHLTFHVFGLAPLIALLVLWPTTSRRRELGMVAAAALCIAAIVFAGGVAMILPMLLGVVVVIAIAAMRTGMLAAALKRLGAAALWSIPISAIKLVPAWLLIEQFPRTTGVVLVPTFTAYLAQLAQSLFLPETLPPFIRSGTGHVALSQHEFEYGISLVPLLLLVALIVRRVQRPRRALHIAPIAILVVVAVIVSGASFGSPGWAQVLHRIPIVAGNSVGPRWWIAWMMGLIVAGAGAIDHLANETRGRPALLLGCAAVLLAQVASRPLERYTTDKTFSVYDPAPARAAMAHVQRGAPMPPITAIAKPIVKRESDAATPWSANDGVFDGQSAVPCYEPLFDHDFHLFPARQLVVGPITDSPTQGAINLADPRCYFSGGCQPGSLFRADDAPSARRFAAHEPLEWNQPWWQRLSARCTIAAMAMTLFAMGFAIVPIRRSVNQRD